MRIGKTDEELIAAGGYASRLYSACKRLAWASLVAILPSFFALSLAFSDLGKTARLVPAVLVIVVCLGAFLWGVLWPRVYPSRRGARRWALCLLGVFLLFIPSMILSIGSVVAQQYAYVAFDYATPSYQPGCYPAASFLAEEYIPPAATSIRLKGNSGLAWSAEGYAAFSCEVSEEDFLAFAKGRMYELRREEDLSGLRLPVYGRLFPGDLDPSPAHYWAYRLAYPNGGGVTLVFDLATSRLLGEYTSD